MRLPGSRNFLGGLSDIDWFLVYKDEWARAWVATQQNCINDSPNITHAAAGLLLPHQLHSTTAVALPTTALAPRNPPTASAAPAKPPHIKQTNEAAATTGRRFK